MRILIAEDDARVASFIRRGLREEHYTVDVAKDGEEALFLAQTGDYDALILDIMMPKRTGIEVLQALRADRVAVPVLFLTAKDELHDRVKGLDAGADDYLTKPFGFDELLARLRALIRLWSMSPREALLELMPLIARWVEQVREQLAEQEERLFPWLERTRGSSSPWGDGWDSETLMADLTRPLARRVRDFGIDQ